MANRCYFSRDRIYRYSLKHCLDDIHPENSLLWIGLNPSTADENTLDPTLRKIRFYTARAGFNIFVVCNLFAFRSTDPMVMRKNPSPIGPHNDSTIVEELKRCENRAVVCWGKSGRHQDRDRSVLELLHEHGIDILCLGVNLDGSPKHPLYLRSDAPLIPYTCNR